MAFEKELATYSQHLLELLASQGKYVVIRNDVISGPFDSYEEALQEGYDRYGLESFLVKQIHKAEPIHYFSRDLPACPS